ncbi:hypothetical protein GCM10010094_12280 [Streptomyces flaveus]|uniref:Uncharacterized protein n=1 Tax=Streptomyces flaveus TaxID=66370 RepID=A0A917QKD2_9ACTN|nr:hypothetical protein GCM10010094_12280 [Streptomyces flaveus]
MIPGNPTERSRSPAATLTAPTFGAAEVARTDGSSVEDMRQCYETITCWIVCSPSQVPLEFHDKPTRTAIARPAVPATGRPGIA